MASVDGIWFEWNDWSDCSRTCAMGSQSRNRTCVGPFFGGANCTGDQYEVQDCLIAECPGKFVTVD